MKFNINDYVKIRITHRGREILRKRHDDLIKYYSTELRGLEYKEPIVDENGYSRWQLWEVMEIFGPYMGNGFKVCFETEIEIEEK